MIAQLHGAIEFIGKDHLVVNIGAALGFGLRVYVPSATLAAASVGRTIDLFTHLQIREDAWTLFGFTSQEELELFELLIGVSGVGAKTALATLAAAPPDQLRNAIAHEQADVLTRVPGIGPKTAKNIVFHLKDKVGVITLANGDVHLRISLTKADELAAYEAIEHRFYEEAAALP